MEIQIQNKTKNKKQKTKNKKQKKEIENGFKKKQYFFYQKCHTIKISIHT